MAVSLRDLKVLVVDAQASGATPAHGDLLELAWAVCGPEGLVDVQSHFVLPRTGRRISAAVREITGFSEERLAESLPEQETFARLSEDVQRLIDQTAMLLAPTVIHVARFELPFLRDLYARLENRELPLDALCVHAIALRLFPDLPRRNIRALSGFLGHSLSLTRCAHGHVEATAFIWRAILPLLEERGLSCWPDLTLWLKEEPAKIARRSRRTFPLPRERRLALPSGPGVYRFVRKNGSVLYVGKATNLKKRVAGHFRSTGARTERTLELLSQVHDIVITETPSTLEAALLESDEIKAIDPPYNVQLRTHERKAWFASRTLDDARPAFGERHRIGPLPSRWAVSALHALNALVHGEEATPRLLATALAVPVEFLPDAPLFAEGFRDFARELERAGGEKVRGRVARAARTLWLERRRMEVDESAEDLPPDGWDLARVRRRLDRNLIQSGLLIRRARWLSLLADSDLAFRELDMPRARALVLAHAEVIERKDLASVDELAGLSIRRMSAEHVRKALFDAVRYDRLRVLATEMQRVHAEGGQLALRFGRHLITGERLARILREV
jgi:DNA polymerase-3 subunit epsilon